LSEPSKGIADRRLGHPQLLSQVRLIQIVPGSQHPKDDVIAKSLIGNITEEVSHR